jgi:chromosomal replication initiation ATPase DnaA
VLRYSESWILTNYLHKIKEILTKKGNKSVTSVTIKNHKISKQLKERGIQEKRKKKKEKRKKKKEKKKKRKTRTHQPPMMLSRTLSKIAAC